MRGEIVDTSSRAVYEDFVLLKGKTQLNMLVYCILYTKNLSKSALCIH